MDKDVLIRFIQMIETVLGRVNSKRLMLLYGFLYWLYSVKDLLGMNWTGSLGGIVTVITLASFIEDFNKRKGSDAL